MDEFRSAPPHPAGNAAGAASPARAGVVAGASADPLPCQDILRANLVDFALAELVRQHRASFAPLWTIESWAKLLIWLALNSGCSGDIASLEAFAAALEGYLARRWRAPRSPRRYRYDLAILHDPEEAMPPSNKRAIRKFIEAGKKHGIDAELITRRDYAKLAEFDALFIRVTTQVNHYSYRFARRAEREGMVVIDDPLSILRCSNKVYLAELLRRSRIPTPPSVVLAPGGLDAAEQVCGYPVVLKVPDGSFSRGVFKAENQAQLEARSREMFDHSELILAQAYTYTEFDWRVGVLNQQPLYVSQYFMAKKHWQIVKHGSTGTRLAGGSTTMLVEDAPREVVKTALRAANLIGDGFYGVDLKQAPNGDVVVIEVNDNPSVDAGVEDEVLGDQLYERVMQEFLRRLSDISP